MVDRYRPKSLVTAWRTVGIGDGREAKTEARSTVELVQTPGRLRKGISDHDEQCWHCNGS